MSKRKLSSIVFGLVVITTMPHLSQAVEAPVVFNDVNLKAAVEAVLGVTDPTPPEMLGLTSLNAPNNGIIDLTGLEFATNLTVLYLHNNQISDISALTGLTNLISLKLGGNQISDISTLSGLTNLTNLWMYSNQISDISALSEMTNLTDLWLHNNLLNAEAYYTYIPLIETKNPGINLKYDPYVPVTFNDANLKAAVETALGKSNPMPIDMLDLTILHARSSGIADLTGLEYATNLGDLRVDDNRISDISVLSELTNLWYLSMYRNQVSDVSALSGLTNLGHLALQYNQISDVSALSSLTGLGYLALHSNQISDISALSGMTNLIWLYLYINQIGDISALAGLTNLQYLYVGDNPFSDISELSALTNLKKPGFGILPDHRYFCTIRYDGFDKFRTKGQSDQQSCPTSQPEQSTMVGFGRQSDQ